MRNHLLPAGARSQALGDLPGSNRLDLAIGLRLRNREALTNLLQQLYEPASTNYHHYLSAEEFAERFGPTEQDYQRVIAFAKSNGFKVAATHPNRALLDVNASVADIERAFHFKMRVFRHPKETRTFYAPDVEPSCDLAVPLSSISGLDDFVVPRPMIRSFRKSTTSQSSPPAPTVEALVGEEQAYTTGSGPRGCFIGGDFRGAYAPGVSLDGAGQAVGLFQLDGYYASDITAYESLAGLPNVTLTNVLLNGVSGAPGLNNVEVALDIDMAISMAPGLAKVIVYEGRVPNDVLNRMATDNLAKQLSSSWGFGAQVDAAREQIYMQFAAQGQTMLQASGDLGAWVGPITPPSDDPLLTIVGGTLLTTGSAREWLSETTWPESGGGISTTNPIPSYQQGLSMVANQGSTSKRNIPDVAAVADGIWVIVNNGEQGVIGGTSASAPLWAGFAALANQQASASGKPSIGFLNPALYAIGKGLDYTSSFHDITTGNNTNSSSTNKFFAVTGYDLCTGWGTPVGSNLISALVTPPDTLRITPATGVTASGTVGGPFNPAAQSYSLTNFGTTPLSWTLVNTSLWLNASPASGSLIPGGPAASVTLALNSAASNLSAGNFGATVLFSNSSLQSVQSRQFTLAVVTPPVITAQPANQTVFEGMTASFTVGTASNALLFYQWRYDNGSYQTNITDGANISDSATSTLKIAKVTSANVGAYSVIISNAAGTAISSSAFLSIVPWRPVITAQPTNQTVLPGQTVAVQVAAVGSQPLFYRWQKNGTNLTDGGDLSGSASSVLTFSGVSPANAGTYSVSLSNALGSVTSTGAVLTVVPLTAAEITMAAVYSFTGGSDGGGPNGLIRAANGNFYGTAQHGGSNALGTVFSMTTAGAISNLHSFGGSTKDGASPFAVLLQSADGNFYGTTFQGGTNDNGTVFRMNSNGALTTLVSLDFPIGDIPYAGLTFGTDGKLYGTTYQGGGSGFGTVFQMPTNGALKTLFSFNNGTNGGLVYAGLVQGSDGNFYGTTYKGGDYAYGTVYRISISGTLTTVFSFDYAKGAFPYAGLVVSADGNLYGATSAGGSYGGGTIFRMTPSGLLTNLYSFTGGNDGGGPAATLFLAGDGNFYGTTAYGGAYGVGTVFRMTPNGVFATLAQFDGYDGANPKAALTEGTDGALYGTTENGGASDEGTIFRLSVTSPPQITAQPVSQTVFAGSNVNFNVAVVGSNPLFYRWRENGTNLSDGGNISGSSARILTISNVIPASAASYSVFVSNALGSTTSATATLAVTVSPPVIASQPTNQTLAPGGTAIFSVTAQGNLPLSYRWQKNGTNVSDASNVSGSSSSALTISSAIETNNGTYTVVVSNNLGSVISSPAVLTVIPVSAPGTRLTTLYSFTGGADGLNPNGLAQATTGDLYGTTEGGGSQGYGTAFRLTTNGVMTTLVTFNYTNGAEPRSALTLATDGNLYGTAYFGGTNGVGTIFKMDTGGLLTTVYAFTGDTDGGNPSAALIQGADGNFYGTAAQGGPYANGTVFELNSMGALSNLYAFTGEADGGFPNAALTQGTDGSFYGTTPAGGDYRFGNIFRLTPNGGFTNLHSFTDGTDGSLPTGALALGTDGNFYGTTEYNSIQGFRFNGTVFRITTNGALSTLYALNYTDGAHPTSGVIEGSDGNFYGTTYGGAINNNGTVFSISPNGILTNLVKFDGFDDGAHPDAALVEGAEGSFYGTTTSGGPRGRGTVFRLSITNAPWLTMQPASQAVWPGANVTFSVAVFGAPPLFYHWQKNGTNLTDGGKLSGSTSRILQLANVNATDAGTYSVIVSNALGSVTSFGALLTTLSPPFIQTVTKSNTTLRLTWTSIPGQRYRLQYKSAFSSAVWSNLGNIITASSNTATASDPIGSNSQRFYRVVLLP